MQKTALTLIIALLISAIAGILHVGLVASESIPKPSIPRFTLSYVDKSYDVPPTTTSATDPYTNKTTTTKIPGYHVENSAIEVAIKNQPFPSTVGGNTSNLYYDVRIKGHYEEDWNEQYSFSGSTSGDLQVQSSSEYTVLSFPANSYPPDGEVDFQVEAFLGYQYSYDNYFYNQQPHMIPIRVNLFIYERSGWSNTQTLTISADALTPSRVEETQRIGLSLFILGLVIAAILVLSSVGLVLYFKKHRH